MSILKKKTAKPERKKIVEKPEVEKAPAKPVESLDVKAKPFKRVVARLTRRTDALAPGDVGRWTFPRGGAPVTRGTRFHTPACDDLAAAAAALSMLDLLRGRPGAGHIRVLLTRAEEVGFVGTLRACKDGTIERVAETFADADLDRLDGITVTYPDWWCNVRKSNTEPLLRLTLEAEDRGVFEDAKARLFALLGTPVVGH